ncbi:MAG: phosphate acetyltransferase [Lachnospiraceae bacterium]|nr:phosphate acetyltransferase [Lachnospiraceae bacterium]
MNLIEKLESKLKGKNIRVAFPEGDNPKVLKAVVDIYSHGYITPFVIGKPEKIQATAEAEGLSLEGLTLIDPETTELLDEFAAKFAEKKPLPIAVIKKLLSNPNNLGAAMLEYDFADTLVSGAVTSTGEVIAAHKLIQRRDPEVESLSAFCVYDIPHFNGPSGSVLVVCDTEVTIDPTEEELADMAVMTARNSAKLLGWEPKVAMLSFSTAGSASHEKVTKMQNATKLAQEKAPDLKIDGEFQLDTAIIPEIAATKLKRPSEVAGQANILIFPDLNVGNICYKTIERIAGATTNNAVVQGFRKPICDLSRGCTAQDAANMIVIMASIAANS